VQQETRVEEKLRFCKNLEIPHLAEGKNMEKRVKAQWYFRRCQFLDLNPVRLALKPEIGSDGLPQPTPLPVNLPQRLTRISFQRTGCQAGGLVK